jgi:hypothetical protein
MLPKLQLRFRRSAVPLHLNRLGSCIHEVSIDEARLASMHFGSYSALLLPSLHASGIYRSSSRRCGTTSQSSANKLCISFRYGYRIGDLFPGPLLCNGRPFSVHVVLMFPFSPFG